MARIKSEEEKKREKEGARFIQRREKIRSEKGGSREKATMQIERERLSREKGKREREEREEKEFKAETPIDTKEKETEGKRKIIPGAFVGTRGEPMPGLSETKEEARTRELGQAGRLVSVGLAGAGASTRAIGTVGRTEGLLGFVKDSYKALDKAEGIRVANKVVLRFTKKPWNLQFNTAAKTAKNLGEISTKDMLSLLGKKPGILKKATVIGAGVIGTTGIMTWMAVDNIGQSSGIFARDSRFAVTNGEISPAEGLEALEDAQQALDLARSFTTVSSSINPFLWPFKKLINQAFDTSQNQITFNRELIERMKGGI